MTCPNCGKEVLDIPSKRTAAQSLFCPNCGTLLRVASSPDEEPPSPVAKQKQLPIPKPPTPSPGPLLTGWIALDTALGFLEEIVAAALIVYAFVVFGSSGFGEPLKHAAIVAVGALVSAFFLLLHVSVMRKRYPSFTRGWEKGRVIWGKGVDHLVTLLFGMAMLAILLPLGGLLICLGLSFGPIAWVGGLIVAYLFGILARRMTDASRGKKKP